MEDVFEEYRERLLKKDVDILILEIYETFVGTDFINNSLDLVQTLESKDYDEILQELKTIKENIYNIENTKYTGNERLGYSDIVSGYIRRVESILYKEKSLKQELLQQAKEILNQDKLDVETAESWIKKYKKYITKVYKKRSRDYEILNSCIITIDDKIEFTTSVTVAVNKLLLKTSIQMASELLKYY